MSELSSRILNVMQQRGLSYGELATETQIPKSALQRYATGETEKIPLDRLEKIATALHVETSWLLGWDLDDDSSKIPGATPYVSKGSMPILGRVAAGLPMYADENIEGYIANDFDDGEEYFALKVQGDSMNAAGIGDGDYIVVRKQSAVDNGEIAVVLVNGYDATVKRFTRKGTTVFLNPQSYNPEHQVQIYNASQIAISIVGKVVEVRKRF